MPNFVTTRKMNKFVKFKRLFRTIFDCSALVLHFSMGATVFHAAYNRSFANPPAMYIDRFKDMVSGNHNPPTGSLIIWIMYYLPADTGFSPVEVWGHIGFMYL
jgi:hypothetical protein